MYSKFNEVLGHDCGWKEHFTKNKEELTTQTETEF